MNRIFCDRCNGPQDERTKGWSQIDTSDRRGRPYDLCPGCSIEFDRFIAGDSVGAIAPAYAGNDDD